MENENEESNPMERAVPPPPRQSQAKQPRFDLDDKFGKFEIKNLPHCKLHLVDRVLCIDLAITLTLTLR